jgi:hypothetical protein
MGELILRPAGSAIRWQFVRALPIAGLGAVFVLAGISSGNLVPWLLAVALVALSLLIAGNLLFAYIRLEGGVLTSATLLNRRSVNVAEITAIVPFHPTFIWHSRLRDRRSHLPVCDVRKEQGSAGIWLNPEVYGEQQMAALIDTLSKSPSVAAASKTRESPRAK